MPGPIGSFYAPCVGGFYGTPGMPRVTANLKEARGKMLA